MVESVKHRRETQAEETGVGGSKTTWGGQVEEAEMEEAVKAKTCFQTQEKGQGNKV